MRRYRHGQARLFGARFAFCDALTMLSGLDEIFGGEVYRFHCDRADPLIVDCGANVGLSVVYFKRLLPEARIIAFEPDPDLFAALKRNVEALALSRVELHNAAVWTTNGKIDFVREGGFSGRIPGSETRAGDTTPVDCRRLRDFLDQQVDFLKVDIEGAESKVIPDCADRLHNVARLFVEYHSESASAQRLQDLLAVIQAAGFRYYLKEAFVAAHPFVRLPTMMGMDMQLNLFAMRDCHWEES